MIHEAIAAAEHVVRALLLWIVLAAALATAVTFALIAAGWAAWRTVAAVWAVCAWLSWRPRTELPPCAPTEGAGAPVASRGRTGNPVPAWARTDEEAA